MGRMSLGCCSSSGPAPSASAASLAIRLWGPGAPTHPSPSSLSGSCWTSSTNRSPRGRRPRGDTGWVERRAVGTRPLVVGFVVESLAPLAKAAYAPEDVPGSVSPLPERPYEPRSGVGVRPYDGGDIDSRTT